jgi:BASS family bile acid:Na+ symporter
VDVDSRTIAIETAIQNGGTAMLVTGTILNNPAMTVAPVMYGILMLAPLFAYLLLRRVRGAVTVSAAG